MSTKTQSAEYFASLPRRIFLDSSTLQTLQDYGEFIWENVEPSPADRIHTMPGGYDELDALRAIFFVNQRSNFEFALSKHSFEEVAAKNDRTYLQWAYDVLDHWEACLAGYAGHPFSGTGLIQASHLDDPCFGYLSTKDRLLIQDALALECDAFLTMESRLPKNADHLRLKVGLLVLRPRQYWNMLSPWAPLYT